MGNYYDLLQQWTNRIVPHVIFISKGLKNLDVRELNNSICGKKDVMFIVVTKKNNIFGCYTSEIIPAAPARATKSKDNCLTVSNDPNHFIFSLQNTNKLSPPNAFRLKNQTDCSIGVYSPKIFGSYFYLL
ncbi:TLDc domain-containing protein [Entamoeba marina]